MSKNKETLIHDMTEGSVPRQLLMFAAPLFLSGLLQTVYNMVDMVVVGKFVGSEGLSAVAAGGEVLNMLTFIAMGISNAGQIIMSQYIGAGERQKLGRLVGTMASFLFLCAAVMTGACLMLRVQVLQWIHMQKEAFPYALDYIIPCICGLVFIYGYNLISAILRGMGDSRHPFLFVTIASVVNMVLDLLFVAKFGMGTFGAALATVIGQAVSFFCSLLFLWRRRERIGFIFHRTYFQIKREILYELLKLGIPMALQTAAITFSKLFITSWINRFGVVAAAVTGIGNKLSMITNVFAQALATAGGTMIAQNLGAKKYVRVPKIIRTTMIGDAIVASVFAAVTLFWPKAVFGIFSGEAEVLEMAVTYVPTALLMYAGCVLRPPMMALINGSGNSGLNLTIALVDGMIARIGLALLLGVACNMGIYGFWYGNALAGFVPFFVGGVYYLSGRWKKK